MIRPVLEAVARIGKPSVRVVSPLPPHDPEPHQDEPFAPVYHYEPMDASFSGMRIFPPVGEPRWPDRLVFGPEYQRYGITLDLAQSCGPCGVTWAAGTGKACWYCGRPA